MKHILRVFMPEAVANLGRLRLFRVIRSICLSLSWLEMNYVWPQIQATYSLKTLPKV